MDFIQSILERNATFAETEFDAELKMMPTTGTIILGCVDPRVDPFAVLGLKQGETAVIRNVGGRVNKPILETLGILRSVAASNNRPNSVQNLVILHHTDCGIIGCYYHSPDQLAGHMGVDTPGLEKLAITNPYESVKLDILTLKAIPQLPDGLVVTGLVYDVKTGRVETVVPSERLRPVLAA